MWRGKGVCAIPETECTATAFLKTMIICACPQNLEESASPASDAEFRFCACCCQWFMRSALRWEKANENVPKRHSCLSQHRTSRTVRLTMLAIHKVNILDLVSASVISLLDDRSFGAVSLRTRRDEQEREVGCFRHLCSMSTHVPNAFSEDLDELPLWRGKRG